VAQAVDVTTAALGRGKLLFAVHVCENVEPGSLAEVTARFPWSAMKAYDINAPGQKTPGCSWRRGAGCPERCQPTAAAVRGGRSGRHDRWPKNETTVITDCTRIITKRTFTQVRTGGQGQDRTADLPLFRRICGSRSVHHGPVDRPIRRVGSCLESRVVPRCPGPLFSKALARSAMR
jgi:hypothetical protein